jgi:glyoxylase-like metal-dependent hydrolase (beta-lactamase superfamily II)
LQSFSIGEATVRVFQTGDYKFRLADLLNVPESEWKPRYGDIFEKTLFVPSNSVLIELPSTTILVDPNDYKASCPPSSEYFPGPEYKPPPDLIAQFKDFSKKPEDITHVLITHAHYDHYAGVTRLVDGSYEPAFPNAKYYLGAEDWDSELVSKSLLKENSGARKTLGVLRDRKILELVRGVHNINDQVRIIPAPGESPGHQVLKLSSRGQSLYCVGDLFHHGVEVEQPNWCPEWADKVRNMESRTLVSKTAFVEKALVVPGHMKAGRIKTREGSTTEFLWEPSEQSSA